MMHRLAALMVALACWALAAPSAHAGGGPERVLVVANEDSPLSLRVARHYMERRGIHPTHLCRLGGIPSEGVVSLSFFKEKVLGPIKAYIKTHGLEDTIDIITYSVDFPFGVNYGAQFKDLEKLNKPPVAALTGVTYLHELVEADDPRWLKIQQPPNAYTRFTGRAVRDAHGYRRSYRWGEGETPGRSADDDGDGGYFLCTVLGFAGVQGNTTEEILASIDRGVDSDGTMPKGHVYLMENPNVRSTTRMPFFETTHKMLEDLIPTAKTLKKGEDGEDGVSPKNAQDIMGLVAGIATFKWPEKSTFLPGAIAEHLTSFGARLDGSGQTKCTEYIRRGATGTSGTVAEPYALWPKFPLPFIHAHYAAGSSLAEAFYQNVASPYQLLIIGDPLATPYAKRPTVVLAAPSKAPLTATQGEQVALNVLVKTHVKERAADVAFELYIDGKLVEPVDEDTPLVFDTASLTPGSHTLRIVAIESTPIETRGSTVVPLVIEIADTPNPLTAGASKQGEVDWTDTYTLKGRAKGLKTLEVLDGHRVLTTGKVLLSGSYKLEIDSTRLGPGLAQLTLRGAGRDGSTWIADASRDLLVQAPEALKKGKPARRTSRRRPKDQGAKIKPGAGLVAHVTVDGGDTIAVVVPQLGKRGKNTFAKTIRAKVKGKITRIVLKGTLKVETAGEYRLVLAGAGSLTLTLDHAEVVNQSEVAADAPAYALVRLKKQGYAIELTYEVTGTGELSVSWGGPIVNTVLGGAALAH